VHQLVIKVFSDSQLLKISLSSNFWVLKHTVWVQEKQGTQYIQTTHTHTHTIIIITLLSNGTLLFTKKCISLLYSANYIKCASSKFYSTSFYQYNETQTQQNPLTKFCSISFIQNTFSRRNGTDECHVSALLYYTRTLVKM